MKKRAIAIGVGLLLLYVAEPMIITEYLCSERPTDANLSAFEKLIHGTLPEDYKAFLKTQNGGRPQPRRFQFMTRAGREEDSAVHYFFALYEGRVGNLKKDFEILKGRIPSDCLPIATDPFGNIILLGIADQNLGRVYFWDHEKEDENSTTANISPIALSFSEFIEQLVYSNPENPSRPQPWRMSGV